MDKGNEASLLTMKNKRSFASPALLYCWPPYVPLILKKSRWAGRQAEGVEVVGVEVDVVVEVDDVVEVSGVTCQL